MPRAGLTPQRVVEIAALVADRDGPAALSLAAVAAEAGVRVPSLYKHVDGLPDLLARLGELGTTELRTALRAAVGDRSGRDALLAAAATYRGYALRFPGRFAAARPDAAVDILVQAAAGYGRPDVEATARTLQATLLGLLVLEQQSGDRSPDPADAFLAGVALLERALR